MKKTIGVLGAAMLAAIAGACGGTKPEPTAPHVAAGGSAAATADGCGASSVVVPLGSAAGSSTIALARVSGRRVAFVADEDAKAVLTVDLDTREQLASTPLPARPGQLLVTNDGRVLVTLRDGAKIVSLGAQGSTAPLAMRCEASTPVEPVALATAADGTIYVATGWGAALAAFDGKTLALRWTTPLSREPRSVVVSDDGKTAFVSHAVGSHVSAVALDGKHGVEEVLLEGAPEGARAQQEAFERLMAQSGMKDSAKNRFFRARPSCQGFALTKAKAMPGRVFAPEVFVDPGDLEQRPDGYGDASHDTESPNVAIVDEGTKKPLASSVTVAASPSIRGMKSMQVDARSSRPDCLLPRAATIDESTKSLLVTCFGIDAVVAYDAQSPSPLRAERKRWTVGSGPTGVAVDVEKHRGVVWSQFDRTVTTFPIGGTQLGDERAAPPTVTRTAMPALREKLPAEYALGRVLFHAAGDLRLSGDGRACASCHPDGRDDGITWATPEGPRRSIMLAGRVTTTPPYSWNGNEHSIASHLGNTFDRLSGDGLHGIELDALVTYVSQMPAPPQAAALDATARTKVDRGRQIFASKDAGCASCHSGALLTDGQNHEVASKHAADRASAFNTPSLRFIGGTGPYFHDGRYATLRELLEKTDGTMGKTSHLTVADRDALEAYLRTL